MSENKRIILVGPTATGKNFIREAFQKKGYLIDVSYTTREPRENETEGIDYRFISKKRFLERINESFFYEYVKYGDNYYGTGNWEWNKASVFIMETDGINKIKTEDRTNCLIIYVNTLFDVRLKRMKERGWDMKEISERTKIDLIKFKDFKNYDIEICSMAENEI
jgi:guanylate kinase